jgi:hypothetical protein
MDDAGASTSSMARTFGVEWRIMEKWRGLRRQQQRGQKVHERQNHETAAQDCQQTQADYKLLKGCLQAGTGPFACPRQRMMRDIVEVERQHKELAKMNLQPPVEIKGDK